MDINYPVRKSALEYPDRPICGSGLRNEIVKGKPFSLVECNSCGLNYVYPRIKEKRGINQYKTSYFKNYVSDIERRLADSKRYIWDIEKLLPYIKNKKDGSSLLYDLGCGSGGFTYISRYILGKALGFDLKSSSRSLADTKFSYLNVKDINNLKKYPKADIVSCLHVLEHLYDPRRFLKTVVKPCLKKGGIALIEVPNWGSIQAREQKNLWAWYKPTEHIIQFTTGPLKELLKSEGFRILDVYEDYPTASDVIENMSIKTAGVILISKILRKYGLLAKSHTKKGPMLGIIVKNL